MRARVWLAGCFLVPLVALAQNDDFEADVGATVPGMPGGIQMNVRVKEGKKDSQRSSTHEEQSGDGYRVTWDTDPEGGTWFKVLSPEGYPVRVLDDKNFPRAQGNIPVSFPASGKRFYQVEVRSGSATFVKKFEAKTGMVTQVSIATPGPEAPPSRVEVRVTQPPEPHRGCGPDSDLAQLSSAIEEESFSQGKLRVLEDAAQGRFFCVDHAARLLKLFDFENDKLTALRHLAPRLSDRQNKFKLYQAFDFDSGREKAKQILK